MKRLEEEEQKEVLRNLQEIFVDADVPGGSMQSGVLKCDSLPLSADHSGCSFGIPQDHSDESSAFHSTEYLKDLTRPLTPR